MKVALVQEWFVVNGGAEKVVREIVAIYPDADVFSLVDFLNDSDRQYILAGKRVTTSYLQHFPFSKTKYRNYLLFFPHAIESLDFTGYDLIISSSYAVALHTNCERAGWKFIDRNFHTKLRELCTPVR